MSQHDDDRCTTCGHTEAWHQEYRPRHPFAATKEGSTAFLGEKKTKGGDDAPVVTANQSPWPMDPVLRTALINKGILTPQDLRDAEDHIRAVTGQFEAFAKESRNDEFAEEARGRQV